MPDIVQRSFTSGELAPSLRSRTDLGKYQSGLALCENFIVRAQGGVYSRPGTRFIGELGDSTKRGVLLPFSFSTEQTYVLVFEHLKMRVIKDGGYIETAPGVPYELVTPYTEAQLSRLDITQDADVLTIVHQSHDPRNLNRITEINWTLTVNSYAPTVTAPTISSVVSVGAGHGTNSKTYTYVVTAVDINGIESLASSSGSQTIGSLSTTGGLRITWGNIVAADYYRIYKDPSDGTDVYGWIGNSNNLTFDDFNIAPITSDSHPIDRQPFTGADNKPSTVSYYQQRQIFGNTNNEPQAVYTTQTGNSNSFRKSSPVKDDDAVTFTIKDRQVNEIRHILSLDTLIFLTSGGEWKATENQDQVLTPATMGIKPQSFNGSSFVSPVIINDTAIYVQEKGSRIRDLGYEFSADKFKSTDLSLMSEHLFESHQIEKIAFAAEPYGILWCVRDDGILLGLTYQREHQVWGWHQHDLGGTVESITTISEDDRDALYMIVKRTIDGSDVRYIERMEIRDTSSATNAFCVDSGLSYNGAPATVISGLGHLEGEEVAVLADGNEVTGLTVSTGSITLSREASVVHVGLAYTPAIELLDIDTPGMTSLRGREVSVSRVVIEVESSRGGFVGPKLDDGSTGQMLEIKPRFESDGYDTIALKTFKQEVPINPQWTKGGGVRIEQRSPLPLAILSVIPTVDIGG